MMRLKIVGKDRSSEEVVPGRSVFPSGEPGMSGNFWMSQEGCQVPCLTSRRNMGLPLRRRTGQGPHIAKMSNPQILQVHILPLLSSPFIDMPSSDSTFFSHLSPQPTMFPQTFAFYNTYYKSSSILTILLPYLKLSIYP